MSRFRPPTSAAAKARAMGIKLALEREDLETDTWATLFLLMEQEESDAIFLAHMENQKPARA